MAFAPRHSTPVQTLQVYAKRLRGTDRDAAIRLPVLATPEPLAMQATGTDHTRLMVESTGGPTGWRTGGNGNPERSQAFTSKRGRDDSMNAENPDKHCAETRLAAHESEDLRQAAAGFEPANNGFAIRPLEPLGYAAVTAGLQVTIECIWHAAAPVKRAAACAAAGGGTQRWRTAGAGLAPQACNADQRRGARRTRSTLPSRSFSRNSTRFRPPRCGAEGASNPSAPARRAARPSAWVSDSPPDRWMARQSS